MDYKISLYKSIIEGESRNFMDINSGSIIQFPVCIIISKQFHSATCDCGTVGGDRCKDSCFTSIEVFA